MLTLYGTLRSRAFRSLWTLREAGVEYEFVQIDFAKGETRTPAFLKLNPNGHVPLLVDGESVIWESLAINMYIARKYSPALWPQTIAQEGELFKWSSWALTELEGPIDVANKMQQRLSIARAKEIFNIIDTQLNASKYLLGEQFTVADINVASVLMRPAVPSEEMEHFSNLNRWFQECLQRVTNKVFKT